MTKRLLVNVSAKLLLRRVSALSSVLVGSVLCLSLKQSLSFNIVGIRRLQHILMKVCLLLGVEIFAPVQFKQVVPPDQSAPGESFTNTERTNGIALSFVSGSTQILCISLVVFVLC